MIAFMLALALLLIPMSTLGADDGGDVNQYRIGSTGQIYIAPEDMDSDSLYLNGFPYRPNISTSGFVIINATDLVTVLRLAAAKDYLMQQGINDSDLFIRNGKVFLADESKADLLPAERAQLLADVRAFLLTLNIGAMNLEGKEFTLADDSDHKITFMIQSVWQSPLDPPGYDPLSVPIPPVLTSTSSMQTPAPSSSSSPWN